MDILQFPAKRTSGPFAQVAWNLLRPDAWERALELEGGDQRRAHAWLTAATHILQEANKPRRMDARTPRERIAMNAARVAANAAHASEREKTTAIVTALVSARSGIPVEVLAGAAD